MVCSDPVFCLLQELEGGGEEEEPDDVEVEPIQDKASGRNVAADVQKIQARERMYHDALTFAKQKGENAKVRRFERALLTMAAMSKDAMAGKPVNLDNLPPQVHVGIPSAEKHRELDSQYQAKHQQEQTMKDAPERATGTSVTECPVPYMYYPYLTMPSCAINKSCICAY